MANRLYVIIAIHPYNDADTVAVSATKEGALAVWASYMRNGETKVSDVEEEWLSNNATYLADFGKSERQDSGTFYRLNPMIAG